MGRVYGEWEGFKVSGRGLWVIGGFYGESIVRFLSTKREVLFFFYKVSKDVIFQMYASHRM